MFQESIFEKNVFSKARTWIEQGKKVAIATVISTWGSSPRQVGSMMIVRDDNLFYGSVSGGCVEGDILNESKKIIKDNKFKIMNIGVDDQTAWSNGLSCGGKISVFICCLTKDVINRKLLNKLSDDEELRNAYQVVFCLKNGTIKSLNKKNNQTFYDQENHKFYYHNNPEIKLIIIGATHISQFLASISIKLGFEVIIIDPRETFANNKRFRDYRVIVDWPSKTEVLKNIDSRTAFVTLTHDSKIDEDALETILPSAAFYIGCLGSRRTHKNRISRLENKGLDKSLMTKISAPVGLNIGSRKPSEIAISIIAEIIKHKNNI